MVSSAQISQAETEFIDNIFSPELTHPSPVYDEIPLATDEYSSNLANISSVLTPNTLYIALHRACEDSKYKISIGSTNANTMKNILDNYEYTANDADNFLQDLDLENTIRDIDSDEIMIEQLMMRTPRVYQPKY